MFQPPARPTKTPASGALLRVLQRRSAVRARRLNTLAPAFLYPKVQTKHMIAMPTQQRGPGGVADVVALDEVQTHRALFLFLVFCLQFCLLLPLAHRHGHQGSRRSRQGFLDFLFLVLVIPLLLVLVLLLLLLSLLTLSNLFPPRLCCCRRSFPRLNHLLLLLGLPFLLFTFRSLALLLPQPGFLFQRLPRCCTTWQKNNRVRSGNVNAAQSKFCARRAEASRMIFACLLALCAVHSRIIKPTHPKTLQAQPSGTFTAANLYLRFAPETLLA